MVQRELHTEILNVFVRCQTQHIMRNQSFSRVKSCRTFLNNMIREQFLRRPKLPSMKFLILAAALFAIAAADDDVCQPLIVEKLAESIQWHIEQLDATVEVACGCATAGTTWHLVVCNLQLQLQLLSEVKKCKQEPSTGKGSPKSVKSRKGP